MIRHISVAAAAATLAALCASTAARAADTERVTFAEWNGRVERALARNLHYPRPMFGQDSASGVVRVKFNCSESGRPAAVTIDRSSGNRGIDRAAVRAVQQIVTLHPLPAGFTHGQRFSALVVFDTDQDRYDQRSADVRSEASRSNAWYKEPAEEHAEVGAAH